MVLIIALVLQKKHLVLTLVKQNKILLKFTLHDDESYLYANKIDLQI